ncbi:hypothetical protein D1159_09005 [Pseudoflavonifractor sp. 524-17]|uniref:hypothetical protein n=1 Tax=Pseudoflavonifractor sp. 524-17 TaxID=2304577 RepID=UPI0013796A03|nr:hypothetical protein [Pseudoflavonifractor sp. 524-17]NCE64721.1 hypothetical protein [Pseudoflavonifractor sp. 524-17]
MSRVYVLAADKELPLCNFQESHTSYSGGYSVTFRQGFKVEPLHYYRRAVDELGWPMKPFRYEFVMAKEETDLVKLRAYLTENFSSGEVLELWSVWLSGDVDKKRPTRFQGRLADFDTQALKQFLDAEEICFDITV